MWAALPTGVPVEEAPYDCNSDLRPVCLDSLMVGQELGFHLFCWASLSCPASGGSLLASRLPVQSGLWGYRSLPEGRYHWRITQAPQSNYAWHPLAIQAPVLLDCLQR